MKEAFETWARWNIGQPSFDGKYIRDGVFSYNHNFIDKTWQCWQAASKHYEAKLAEMQAKIDALMLEYCPDEMTKEQVSNWMESQSEFLENTEFLAKDK